MNLFKVLAVTFVSENTFVLRVERPHVLIKAGQCFNVGVPGSGINREYSMYSGAQDPFLEFLIRKVAQGAVSCKLGALSPGDFVEIDGPYGEFCLAEPVDEKQHYFFLGTGTGIAPFHSFVRTYPNIRYTLLHGIRFADERYGAEDYIEGSYMPCISRNTDGKESCRLTDRLRSVVTFENTHAYLCGNRSMIIDAFDILRDCGFPADNIFTEVFF